MSAAEWIEIRRHLHKNPELSLQEHQTARYIRDYLDRYSIAWEPCADTGTVALIEGAHDGPTLAFRADIDALPIAELNEVDYRSSNPGVMHACGHDVHTTVGMGIARKISAQRDSLHGSLKVIFQPAEEASPTDDAPIGAERMVAEGVLENPTVDAAFAFHCMPHLDVGKIGYTGGAVWARSDLLEIKIHGEKTHAAYPHEGIDAVVVASHVITALQTVTSRTIDTREPCVISIGQLEAGNSYNIIAESASLTGIVRSHADSTSELAKKTIERVATRVCEALGAGCEVRFTAGARLTANDPRLEARTTSILRELLGDEAVVPHPAQLGAEDFCAFSTRVPSCYLFLGVRNVEKGIKHMIHTPRFDVDEDCLPLAIDAMSETLLRLGKQWRDPC